MVFTAYDRVLAKLLRQKGYSAKKFVAKFPSKTGTLSGLNKRLPKTRHFTF